MVKPGLDPKIAAAAAAAKAGADAQKAADAAAAKMAADQAKADAAAAEVPTPTSATESVMAQSSIDSDVKVNSTHLDAATRGKPGIPDLCRGRHHRRRLSGHAVAGAHQRHDRARGPGGRDSLGITFERIDSVNKVIYFKDSTGAEVSKNY